MAKSASNTFIDGALDILVNNADLMTICSAEPTTLTEAVTTFALADVAMSGVDYTKADGDTNGRKVTVGAKADVPVDVTGTGTHVALIDATTELLYVTTCASVSLDDTGTVDFGAWDIEIADPV